jgi:hypothetical protein
LGQPNTSPFSLEGSPFVDLNGRLYAVSYAGRRNPPGEFFPTPADSLNATMLRR